jgi:hypothetical protein
MPAVSAAGDDVHAFFGATTTLKTNVWTSNDLPMGQSIVHHYQGHTILRLHEHQQPAEEESIPSFIHFIWLGDTPLPLSNGAGEIECINSWRRHHPKWVIQVWRDDDVEQHQWYNAAALKHALRTKNYGMASDILRLELLWEYGGLYVDIDYLCVDSIQDLHSRFDFYCGASNTGAVEVNNGLLACQPRHYLIRDMMERIHKWFDTFLQNSQPFSLMSAFLDPNSRDSLQQVMALTPEDVIRNTGPGLVTTSLAQALACDATSRIAVLPYQVFHPLPNSFRGQALDEQLIEQHIVRGQTKAVHLWQCSWQTP